MRTTFDIDQQSYRLVKAIAAQKGVSMGSVVAEAVRAQYGASDTPSQSIATSEAGFPVISIGRPITSEDVAEQLDD